MQVLRAVCPSHLPAAGDSFSSDEGLRLARDWVLPVQLPQALARVLIAYLGIEVVVLY